MENEFREELQLAQECLEEAKTLFRKNNLKEAATLADRAANLFQTHQEHQKYCESLNVLGIIYNAIGNDNLEIDCFLNGLLIAEKYHFLDEWMGFCINIGSKYQGMGAKEQALDYFNQAIKLLDTEEGQKVPRKVDMNLILGMNLGELYADLGAFSKAETQLNRAREAAKAMNEDKYDFSFLAFELRMMWRLGYHEEVRERLDEVYSMALKSEFVSDYIEIMTDLCKLLKDMKEFEKWDKVLDRLETFVNNDEQMFFQIHMLEMRMEYYTEVGDMDAYRKACEEYVALSMKKRDRENREHVENLDLKIRIQNAAEQRKNAEELINKDSLTGIGSRNKMLNDAIKVIKNSIKNESVIMIGLIDIDFFKQCNDTYGHIYGDECLKTVAKTIQDAVGDLGQVYRFGGDEFLVLIENAKRDYIETVGSCIKERINNANIQNIKSPIADCVTVSQGYTLAIAEKGDTIERLIDFADCVLYRVKKAGRNNYLYMTLSEIAADLG